MFFSYNISYAQYPQVDVKTEPEGAIYTLMEALMESVNFATEKIKMDQLYDKYYLLLKAKHRERFYQGDVFADQPTRHSYYIDMICKPIVRDAFASVDYVIGNPALDDVDLDFTIEAIGPMTTEQRSRLLSYFDKFDLEKKICNQLCIEPVGEYSIFDSPDFIDPTFIEDDLSQRTTEEIVAFLEENQGNRTQYYNNFFTGRWGTSIAMSEGERYIQILKSIKRVMLMTIEKDIFFNPPL